jgi:putative flippase GtrA
MTMLTRALAWSRTHEGKKLLRFTATSVISTVISEAVILIVYGLRWVPSEIGATFVGNLVAVAPAYYLNRNWAWGKSGTSHWRSEVLPYLSMTLLGILFSLLGAVWVRGLVHSHHWSHLVNTGLVGGVNLLSFAIFWVLKMLLFNRIFHVHALEDYDAHLSAEERA